MSLMVTICRFTSAIKIQLGRIYSIGNFGNKPKIELKRRAIEWKGHLQSLSFNAFCTANYCTSCLYDIGGNWVSVVTVTVPRFP